MRWGFSKINIELTCTVCSRKNGFSIKWVFREFSRFLNTSSISQKLVFEEIGFSFEHRDSILKKVHFYKGFPCYFPEPLFLVKMLLKNGLFSRFSTRAQILKNGLSKKWVFLSAFWERKLGKWLTIFARTYCTGTTSQALSKATVAIYGIIALHSRMESVNESYLLVPSID